MEARKLEYHTIDDIYNLPEGERAELINGRLYYMATPSTNHQGLLGGIFFQIYNHIRIKKGPCKVYPAPFAVYLFNDDKTYLEPDVVVVCDPAKLDDKGCHGAPDLVVEIISPSSAGHDYIRKRALYEKAGVREYWIVDPQVKAIYVCTFDGEDPARYSFDDQIKVGIFDDLVIDFAEVEL